MYSLETIIAAKKDVPVVEKKQTLENKEKDKEVKKTKTIAETDRDKLDKKFKKKKSEKLN